MVGSLAHMVQQAPLARFLGITPSKSDHKQQKIVQPMSTIATRRLYCTNPFKCEVFDNNNNQITPPSSTLVTSCITPHTYTHTHSQHQNFFKNNIEQNVKSTKTVTRTYTLVLKLKTIGQFCSSYILRTGRKHSSF